MKKLLLSAISFWITTLCTGQLYKENRSAIKKCEVGFLYYTDIEYPTFVALKDQIHGIQFNDFSTSALKPGFQLNWKLLALDTMSKYERREKLQNYGKRDSVFLRILPVQFRYLIDRYSKSTDQFKKAKSLDKLQINNKFISIISYGQLPINVDSLKVLAVSKQ